MTSESDSKTSELDAAKPVSRGPVIIKPTKPVGIGMHREGAGRNLAGLTGVGVGPRASDDLDEPHTEELILLAHIIPDENNYRTAFLSPANPKKNPYKESDPRYALAQETIEGLIQFAEHLKIEPMQHPVTVYRHQGSYKIIAGSRRFFANLIAHGPDYKISARVYAKRPKNFEVRQFAENEQREDAPLHHKLLSFERAVTYLAGGRDNQESKEPWTHLGISKRTYQRYTAMLNDGYVKRAVLDFVVISLRDAERLLGMEKLARHKALKAAYEKNNQKYPFQAELEELEAPQAAKRGRGRARTKVDTPPINNPKVIRHIINNGLKDVGISWDEVDWNNMESIQAAWNKAIETLFAKMKG